MIIVITTYPLLKPMTREEAQRNFLSTGPRYQGIRGLFRKCYYLSQDGMTIGGVYLCPETKRRRCSMRAGGLPCVTGTNRILRSCILTALL